MGKRRIGTTEAQRPTRFSWRSLCLCGLLISLAPVAAASLQSCDSTVTGTLDILKFDSKVFGNTRMLRVLLPPGYRLPMNSAHRYPVLYLNDGQNLFDVCSSINHEEWRVDETVAALVAAREIPPIIVVGIDNAGRVQRTHEYLPYPDETLSPPDLNPQGQKYPQFLLGEVVPFIEDHYRVRGGPGNRVLGGSSYGAGAALYTVIAHPGSFAGLLLESPSVYASGYQLLKDAAAVHDWPHRIFIGTGTVQEPVEDVNKLAVLFRQAGFDDRHLRVMVQEGGRHSESWWAKRLPDALKFLFAN
jgi:enterochelin esterase-like enzyme